MNKGSVLVLYNPLMGSFDHGSHVDGAGQSMSMKGELQPLSHKEDVPTGSDAPLQMDGARSEDIEAEACCPGDNIRRALYL